MGHNLLEQKPGRGSVPATEQKPNEIALAQSLRLEIGEFLGADNYRHIDFVADNSLPIITRRGVRMTDGKEESHANSAGEWLLGSKEWTTPDWTPMEASIFKKDSRCEIEIRGYKGIILPNYGLHLVLDGNYPRIDNIFPADSLEAAKEEKRQLHGKCISPEPVPNLSAGQTVKIPARSAELRSRKSRLEYGLFLMERIKIASTAVLLPQFR